MKRLKYAVILLLGLSMATMMTSCNKESSYKDKIVGVWQTTKETIYTYDLSGSLINESSYDDYSEDENYRWEFFSEGLVKTSGEIWHKTNSKDYFISYVIDGNRLIFSLIGDTEEYTILELTNSTMEWEQEYVSSYSNCKYVYRYEFKKVK